MVIGRITYEDKKDYKIEGSDDSYRVTAKDMNEIKNVFNNSASTIELTEKKVDDAVSFIGTYKLENGLLYFKQADGTFGEGIALAGQTSIVLDDVVQENLTMSSTRKAISRRKNVQVTNDDGVVLIETSSDNVRYLKKDGTDSIDGKTLIDLMAKLISATSFFDVNPKPMLDELKGYVDIT